MIKLLREGESKGIREWEGKIQLKREGETPAKSDRKMDKKAKIKSENKDIYLFVKLGSDWKKSVRIRQWKWTWAKYLSKREDV